MPFPLKIHHGQDLATLSLAASLDLVTLVPIKRKHRKNVGKVEVILTKDIVKFGQ